MNANKKATRLAILCAVLVLFGGNAWAADSSAELAALHAADQAWLKAYNSQNAEAIAARYDTDAVLLPPGHAPVRGRSAIRAFFASNTAESKKAGVTFHLDSNPAGGVSGDMGWASGSYTVTDASGKVLDRGKYLSVSKKEGGEWLYVRDTWNSDGAAPSE